MSKKKNQHGKSYKKKPSMGSLFKPAGVQMLARAREFPFYECQIFDNWQILGVSSIILTREQDNGFLLFASFLVDIFCLGVKDAYYKANMPFNEYTSKVLTRYEEKGNLIDIPIDLAHAIIYGAVKYASSIGFDPHPDFDQCKDFLEPIERFGELPKVKFGKNGKPFYMNGPYDDVDKIVSILDKNLGPGNYEMVIGPNEF